MKPRHLLPGLPVLLLLVVLLVQHGCAWELLAGGEDWGNETSPSPEPSGNDTSPSPAPQPSPGGNDTSPSPSPSPGGNDTSPSPSPGNDTSPSPSPEPEPSPEPSPAPEPSPEPSPGPQPPPGPPKPSGPWQTLIHDQGYCAMYGVCGHRKDGDGLNCPNNTQAVPPSDNLASKLRAVCPSLWASQGGSSGKYCCTPDQVDQLASNVQKVAPFTVGCPACQHNFIQLWCVLTCSSDQATFTNITDVQVAPDTNATVIKEVAVWMDPAFTDGLFDSCKDVKFGAANLPAMNFMGGGAKNGQEWLEFLGTVKDKRVPPVGSPFQLDFNPGGNSTPVPPEITPAQERLPTCGDPLFQCSCADCPPAPGCQAPPPGPPPDAGGCRAGAISCWDLTLILSYICLVGCVISGIVIRRKRIQQQHLESSLGLEAEEPLLGMRAPAAPGEVEEAGDVEDETEPLPGDEHYPWLERKMQTAYEKLGVLCASKPLHVIAAGVVIIGICLLGLTRFHLETDPQRLWVGPGSRAARDKAAFEASFGPFYRVAQIIISTTPTSNSTYTSTTGLPSIVTDANIRLLFDMQYLVDSLKEPYSDAAGQETHVSLPDVCFKPFGTTCATQSILQFWQMNMSYYETEQAKSKWATKLSPDYCFGHWATQCRSAFEAPMDPHVILGGFSTGPDFRNYSADATAFVITYPIDSDPAKRSAALAWEAGFIQLANNELKNMAHAANLSFAFQAERSVEDELKRESYTDASVVAISYLVMLGYITLALAALPPPSQFLHIFVLSRAGLGAAGVLIVAASVAGALGLCSMFGMWSTLIVMEVIPFLVLAVGVDNMFVLAHALNRQDPTLPLVTRAGLALGSAGPSITMAACCEVLAFGLGALTSMPAVRNFSICAAIAVGLDFLLQVTVFMALLVLDAKRSAQSRLDCLPCLRVPYRDATGAWVYEDVNSDDYETDSYAQVPSGPLNPASGLLSGLLGRAGAQGAGATGPDSGEVYFAPQQELPPVAGQQQQQQQGGRRAVSGMGEGGPGSPGRQGVLPGVTKSGPGLLHGDKVSLQSLLQAYMERVHAPLLMNPLVQAIVVALFITGLFVAGALIPRLNVGLDQAVALPNDSYLQQYYRDLYAYLRVGPPLYMVVGPISVKEASPDVNKLCSIAGCQPDSLAVRISQAAMSPASSFIATPAASWIDDFLSWTNPSLPKCCRINPEETPQLGPAGSRCPPPDQPPCSTNSSACQKCGPCFTELPAGGRPNATAVAKYLPWFLESVPSEACAKGGAGAYSTAIQKDTSDPTGIAGLSQGMITSSAFRTYHTPLNSQPDFINALAAARRFAEKSSAELGLEIYPYSIFHIFFEQYLNTHKDAATLVGLPMLAVFITAWVFTGSLWGSVILLMMLTSLMLQLAGAMKLAGIEVNAVSLVNLAMALGIAVEFCAHILHSFCVSHGSRVQRAKAALIKMGAPVTSGITLTKFAGVVVLAFARTQIFEVYYFRLYLALVILGAAHGLVLLPVVLSRVGPPSWSDRRTTPGGMEGFKITLNGVLADLLGQNPGRRGRHYTEMESSRSGGGGSIPGVPFGGGGFFPPVVPQVAGPTEAGVATVPVEAAAPPPAAAAVSKAAEAEPEQQQPGSEGPFPAPAARRVDALDADSDARDAGQEQ